MAVHMLIRCRPGGMCGGAGGGELEGGLIYLAQNWKGIWQKNLENTFENEIVQNLTLCFDTPWSPQRDAAELFNRLRAFRRAKVVRQWVVGLWVAGQWVCRCV